MTVASHSAESGFPVARALKIQRKSSLFQACSRLSVSVGDCKKRAGDERGLVEKELIPPVARSLFRSSSLTESLEQPG